MFRNKTNEDYTGGFSMNSQMFFMFLVVSILCGCTFSSGPSQNQYIHSSISVVPIEITGDENYFCLVPCEGGYYVSRTLFIMTVRGSRDEIATLSSPGWRLEIPDDVEEVLFESDGSVVTIGHDGYHATIGSISIYRRRNGSDSDISEGSFIYADEVGEFGELVGLHAGRQDGARVSLRQVKVRFSSD